MICPYCNKEMEEGEIPTDRYDLKWKPIDRTLIQSIFDPEHRNIRLSRMLEISRCIAYLCRDCKKVIIEYE